MHYIKIMTLMTVHVTVATYFTPYMWSWQFILPSINMYMETYVVKLVQFHVDWNNKAENIGNVLSDQLIFH
jgi:hypothetical protein